MIVAAVYVAWAASYVTMFQIVWLELRTGRRRGWLSHAYMALNRLAIVYFVTAALIALTPTQFSGHLPGFHAALLAASNLAIVALGPLYRHVLRFIPVAATAPPRAWLVRNYLTMLPGAALALLPLALPPRTWVAATLAAHLWALGFVAVGVGDVVRLERRGAWPARGQPDVIIGNLIALVGWVCALAGAAGLAVGLARGVEPPAVWLVLLRSGLPLATVGAFAVRILEQVFRRLAVVVSLVAAAALFFVMYTAADDVADTELRRLIRLLAVWLIAVALPVGQARLQRLVDRIVLRGSRSRQDELLGSLHGVSPEVGIEGCCRLALAEVARVMQLRGGAIILAEHAVAHGDFPLERVTAAWPRGARARGPPAAHLRGARRPRCRPSAAFSSTRASSSRSRS